MTTAYFGNLPRGDAGARATLEVMRKIVNDSLASPTVRETAVGLVRDTAQRDRLAQARAIRRFLQDRMRFLSDPLGVELLHTPEYLLKEIGRRGIIQADCDDAAILGAALAKNIGIPAYFRALAFWDAKRTPYQHVYTLLQTPQGVLDLDTTRPAPMPRPPIGRALTVEV